MALVSHKRVCLASIGTVFRGGALFGFFRGREHKFHFFAYRL